MVQGLRDKQYQYFGSNRSFYSGCSMNSGTAYLYVGFSGTNTGFGTASNELSQRIALASSGVSTAEWAFNSGTDAFPDGALYGNEALTFDGVNQSGLWLRSNADNSKVRVWGW